MDAAKARSLRLPAFAEWTTDQSITEHARKDGGEPSFQVCLRAPFLEEVAISTTVTTREAPVAAAVAHREVTNQRTPVTDLLSSSTSPPPGARRFHRARRPEGAPMGGHSAPWFHARDDGRSACTRRPPRTRRSQPSASRGARAPCMRRRSTPCRSRAGRHGSQRRTRLWMRAAGCTSSGGSAARRSRSPSPSRNASSPRSTPCAARWTRPPLLRRTRARGADARLARLAL